MLNYSDQSGVEDAALTLPHSREAEEAVVGSVLINEFILDELTDLKPEDFYIHRLRFIWQAYLRLREKKQPIDSLTVSEELDDFGRLKEIGGPAYLTSLLNQVPTTLHAEAYAQIVFATSLRRRLLLAANKIATLAYDASIDIVEVADQSTAAVSQAISAASGDTTLNFAEVASELYDQMVARSTLEKSQTAENAAPAPTKRIASGWPSINKMLNGGFGAGRVYVVGGRPGEGKSSWMGGVAKTVAEQGGNAVVFSLEMEGHEVISRIMASVTGVSANTLMDGVPGPDEWEQVVAGMGVMGKMTGGWAEYTPSLTPSRLRAKAHRIKAKYGLDILIVDYIQLMRGEGRGNFNREQEIAGISRELKILAGELRVPILVGAQLSREVEKRAEKEHGDKEPKMADLRESGAIENDADAIIFLWRNNPAEKFSKIKFAKHRNGPVGNCLLRFDTKLTCFVEPE